MVHEILRRKNPTYTYWSLQPGVVLKWFCGPPLQRRVHGFTMVSFTEAVSRRNIFVGGTHTQVNLYYVHALHSVKQTTTDRHKASCGLFATAELR